MENVRLMRHESCTDTLQMAQIPDRKSEKHEEHVLYVDMVVCNNEGVWHGGSAGLLYVGVVNVDSHAGAK